METVSSCAGRRKRLRYRVVVRGFGASATTRVVARTGPLPEESESGLADVRLAGRFVAWRRSRGTDSESVVVLDLQRSQIVTTVRAPAPGLDDILEWLDLRDDGALLISTSADHQAAFVPPGGRPRRLSLFHPGSGGPNDRVRLVGDRVALMSDSAGPLELKVGDLAGSSSRVDRFGRGHRAVAEFDFDGRRVTWAARAGSAPSASIYCARVDAGQPLACR